jgi:hypothetical protein
LGFGALAIPSSETLAGGSRVPAVVGTHAASRSARTHAASPMSVCVTPAAPRGRGLGLGFRVQGSGFWAFGFGGLRFEVLGFRVWGLGIKGFKV